jgi:ribosomal protein S18 acetylase RimI-like enzyme
MVDYRLAGTRDAEAVARLHARSWRESYRGSFTDAFLDSDLVGERLTVWRERLERPPADQLVQLAVDGDDLLGFVCAFGGHDPEWGSFIDNLHVAAEAKRRGIASGLMRRAGAWLADAYPGQGIYLWVLEVNAPARRFYERIGACNSGVSTTETHGGALVQSCRYTWPRPEALARLGADG